MRGIEFLNGTIISYTEIIDFLLDFMKKENGNKIDFYFKGIEYTEKEIMEELEPISEMNLVFDLKISDTDLNLQKEIKDFKYKLDIDSDSLGELLWIDFYSQFDVVKFDENEKILYFGTDNLQDTINMNFIETIKYKSATTVKNKYRNTIACTRILQPKQPLTI